MYGSLFHWRIAWKLTALINCFEDQGHFGFLLFSCSITWLALNFMEFIGLVLQDQKQLVIVLHAPIVLINFQDRHFVSLSLHFGLWSTRHHYYEARGSARLFFTKLLSLNFCMDIFFIYKHFVSTLTESPWNHNFGLVDCKLAKNTVLEIQILFLNVQTLSISCF